MKIYRASTENDISQNQSATASLECALAYTDNPGFGGPTVWAFEVEPQNVLDLTGMSPERALRRLARLTGLDVDERGYGYVHTPFDLNYNLTDALAALGYDWVCYDDSYPEGCVTWRYLGEDIIWDGEYIAGINPED